MHGCKYSVGFLNKIFILSEAVTEGKLTIEMKTVKNQLHKNKNRIWEENLTYDGLQWISSIRFGFLTAHQHKKAISARSTIKLWLLYLKSNYFVSCINSKTYNINSKTYKISYGNKVVIINSTSNKIVIFYDNIWSP